MGLLVRKNTHIDPINLEEYAALAQSYLNPLTWDYFQGGSDDEVTLRANCKAYKHIQIRPRVLVNVSTCSLATTVLGVPVGMPILVAPVGCQGLAHSEGECATVRAAGRAGTIMVVSAMSNYRLEDIIQVASGPCWFQLYMFRDRQVSEELVKRAEAAGYCALVLTVDAPRLGRRERDIRNQFSLPAPLHLANFSPAFGSIASQSQPGVSAIEQHAAITFDSTLTWEVLDWLHSLTSLPILLKGILTAEDAKRALDHGVTGIIVSNHGGRQLDGVPATIDVLPEIIEAVARRCEVYLDGGIRRGTDILKALALGARAILIGRPIIWGLAVHGERGVYNVLNLLRAELELAMMLAGRPSLDSIDSSLIRQDGSPL
jgi:isopentenyl diphosphate isomerase/L-lactate dehydrogenase-like FMN-dependent dehydrogenase